MFVAALEPWSRPQSVRIFLGRYACYNIGPDVGLIACAIHTALLLDTVLALGNDSMPGSPELLRAVQNAIAVTGAAGFGVSLNLIHIYVTPIKRFLQLLWGTGVLGGLALMSTQVRLSCT